MKNIIFVGAPYVGKTTFLNTLASIGYHTLDIGDCLRKHYPNLARNETNNLEDLIPIIKKYTTQTPWAISKVFDEKLTDYLAQDDNVIFYILRYGGPVNYFQRNREEDIEERCRYYFKHYSKIEDYIISKYPYKLFYRDRIGLYESCEH